MENTEDVLPWNWPFSWRVMILLNISFYNFMGNVFAAGLSPMFVSVVEDLGCTFDEVSVLPGYALLALGLANIYALSLCAYIGKRYTILISMAVFFAANIWAAEAKSYNSLLATRFVGGLSAGVIEAMAPLMISELFQEHQLARAMVTYFAFLASGSVFGPLFAGIIVTDLGTWRWFFWISSIVIGVNMITCFIMLPETSFEGQWQLRDFYMEDPDQKLEKSDLGVAEHISEYGTPAATGVEPASYSKLQLWKDRTFFLPWNVSYINRPEGLRWPFISLMLAPFPLLLVPAVFVSTVIYGVSIGYVVILAILAAAILGEPPHLWTAESIGLVGIAGFIGMLIGVPFGGIFADILSKRQRRRSNGEHNPRSRLPIAIMSFLIMPSGLILCGFSLRPEHFTWVGLAGGWLMVGFGLPTTSVITTYSIDTFRAKAGHIGVLTNIVKNSIGFGVSYSTLKWYTNDGPVSQFCTMAGLLWGLYLMVLPLYFYHKRITEFSEKLIAKMRI